MYYRLMEIPAQPEEMNSMTIEQPVTTQTFFKVSLVDPLQALKESFMEEYKDQPEMLKNAGFAGV